jgi:hypothetical protein
VIDILYAAVYRLLLEGHRPGVREFVAHTTFTPLIVVCVRWTTDCVVAGTQPVITVSAALVREARDSSAHQS